MNQIYYNFVRQRSALGGATPAEAAGVGIDGENKWEKLISKSIIKCMTLLAKQD
jgi:hypothetical protein